MRVPDLQTPALVVDLDALDHNIDVMAARRPGPRTRPHVKAFKSTALARHVAERGGHRSFCCATLKEMEGMVAAGLDDDLLLANETLDASRLAGLATQSRWRVTVAVDSARTVATVEHAAAVAGRDIAVLIDVNVGLPRCGCAPGDAGALAELARTAGLEVRGVMGYEGHVVGLTDRDARVRGVGRSLEHLRRAHEAVGGGLVSAGGTGTFDLHDWADELQVGSYLLMDTTYASLGLPFRQAVFVDATVISANGEGGAVADAGLKAFGMDHGEPSVLGHTMFFCSDEHATFFIDPAHPIDVGDRVRMVPAHVDPSVAYHERMWVIRGDEVLDDWPVDLRNW